MRDHITRAGRAGGDAQLSGQHVDGFGKHLAVLGYAKATIRSQVQLVGAFERWLARHDIAALNERVVDAFLDEPRLRRRKQRGSASTLARLLTYLRARGAIVTPSRVVDDSPRAQWERRYHHYLRAERGLATTTVQTYSAFCQQFLTVTHGASLPLAPEFVP